MSAAASKLTIDVPLQPKQVELWNLVDNSPYTRIGYGGSRGGAKSHGARAVMLLRRLKYAGTNGLIFRRTFNDLWENHIQPLFRQYPYMREWYNTQHKELTLPNTSVIKFGYAEHPGDIDQFQGKQYADIAPDEATKLTQEEIEKLMMCNRWPADRGIVPKMWMTMNPGGVGHGYIKRVFLDRKYTADERAEEWMFIQAYGWDNVGWAEKALFEKGLSEADYYSWTDAQRFEFFIRETEYGRVLNAMPGKLRVGHLLGRWDVFAGQYFDIWDPATMTRRVEQMGLRDWWPRWVSIDWGFEHNSAVHWHARGDGRTQTYREYMTNHTPERELARQIAEKCVHGDGRRESIEAIYLSPDAFAKRTSSDTIAQQMGEVFREYGLPWPVPADDDRIGGWQLMYQMLGDGQWIIGDNCTALIDCLPSLTRDEDKVEDVEKVVGDDAADGARYGLKSRERPAVAPLAERVEARMVTASADPSIRAIQLQVALQKERKATPGPVPIRRPWMARRRAWSRN